MVDESFVITEAAKERAFSKAYLGESQPQGLGAIAAKLWASSAAAHILVSRLQREGQIPEVESKALEVVSGLASLLAAANNRVAKALDDELKLKEAMARLESKIQQIVAFKTAPSNSADHINTIKDLVRLRPKTTCFDGTFLTRL